MNRLFHRVATRISSAAGSPFAFGAALALVLLWAASGPFLGFSEVWQLSINTTTTVLTFLMVFVIQHSVNADTEAMQRKLDELIVTLPQPSDAVAGIEKDA